MYTSIEDEEYDDDENEEFTPEYEKYLLSLVDKLHRGELETRSLEEIDREYDHVVS